MEDSDAIRKMKQGEISGLGVLVSRYQVRAIRAAFLITHDRALAEDVVQDTFLRLYQRIGHFDAARPFEPYLMRSVVNAALNTIRRESKIVSLEEDMQPVEYLLAQAASVESQIQFDQLSQEIFAALAKISPRQRAVIIQRYYLEMSEKEMAASLDVAPGTVKWLLHAARTRLGKLLISERSAK